MDITGISTHNHWDRRYLGIYSQFMASMAKVSMSGSLKRTVLWGLWLGVWWGISGNGDFFFVDSWDIRGHRDMINNLVIQCKTNDIQFGADGSKLKWRYYRKMIDFSGTTCTFPNGDTMFDMNGIFFQHQSTISHLNFAASWQCVKTLYPWWTSK
jgi:hypothetical protein